METCPEAVRLPPSYGRTAVASGDPRGVVVVDVDEFVEAERIASWLKLKGHWPVLAPWRGPVVETLDVPVVGVVTEHPDELGKMASRFPGTLFIALVDDEKAVPGADFVFRKPFRVDLALR